VAAGDFVAVGSRRVALGTAFDLKAGRLVGPEVDEDRLRSAGDRREAERRKDEE
jgi:hypothetical protein